MWLVLQLCDREDEILVRAAILFLISGWLTYNDFQWVKSSWWPPPHCSLTSLINGLITLLSPCKWLYLLLFEVREDQPGRRFDWCGWKWFQPYCWIPVALRLFSLWSSSSGTTTDFVDILLLKARTDVRVAFNDRHLETMTIRQQEV